MEDFIVSETNNLVGVATTVPTTTSHLVSQDQSNFEAQSTPAFEQATVSNDAPSASGAAAEAFDTVTMDQLEVPLRLAEIRQKLMLGRGH